MPDEDAWVLVPKPQGSQMPDSEGDATKTATLGQIPAGTPVCSVPTPFMRDDNDFHNLTLVYSFKLEHRSETDGRTSTT